MDFIQDEAYHIYNRGNNRQPIFFSDDNYHYFMNKLATQLKPFCDILCWCLMPNHFHLIINANEDSCKVRSAFGGKAMQELPFRIGKLTSSYAQGINKQNKTVGSIFQQKTKAKILTANPRRRGKDYLLNAIHYCHQNPWKAGLVRRLEDWPYSSFLGYCGFGNDNLCNQSLFWELTGFNKEQFLKDSYGVIGDFDLEE